MNASDILIDAGLDVPEAVDCWDSEDQWWNFKSDICALADKALEALAREVVAEKAKRVDQDYLVQRAIEGSRKTAVSPRECLLLLAQAEGLLDAHGRVRDLTAALAHRERIIAHLIGEEHLTPHGREARRKWLDEICGEL